MRPLAALSDKETSNFVVAFYDGKMERGPAVSVLHVNVGTMFQQDLSGCFAIKKPA